jgi:Protein of unknown function (DUF3179)
VGPDNKSIRVFRASLHSNEAAPEYYREISVKHDPGSDQPLFMDSASGSEWSFRGCAVNGKLKGRCLAPVAAIKDYWFDWRNYHPDTSIFHR